MKITGELLNEVLGDRSLASDFVANGISIDSRTLKPGNMFIAINRGHEFVGNALNSGASSAVIDDIRYAVTGRTILVENTTEFLKRIGRTVKNRVSPSKLIAITGSVGKTTTKTWLNSILSRRFNSFCGIGNYNTIYGVPISLSLLEPDIEFGIFEMGSNHPGEISELSRYLEPDIGVTTNIYESHIGNFGSKASLAKEKISIVDGIKPGGTLIYDGDSEFRTDIENAAIAKRLRGVSVGFSRNCDFSVSCGRGNVTLNTPVGTVEYSLQFSGKHYAYMSAIVVAILYSVGLNVHEYIPFLKDLTLLDGRGSIKKFEYNGKVFDVIDDSYNASPSAMFSSLDVFKSMPAKSKIAVIGQMGELGDYSEYYHGLVAEKFGSSDLDTVFFIGDENLWNTIRRHVTATCFDVLNDTSIGKILESVDDGSIILLKGSHSVGLNKILKYLKCSIV